tara:strand:- start:700 stop:819 length:120 start_codon:yes stop_codon:yes gene_type:complete
MAADTLIVSIESSASSGFESWWNFALSRIMIEPCGTSPY